MNEYRDFEIAVETTYQMKTTVRAVSRTEAVLIVQKTLGGIDRSVPGTDIISTNIICNDGFTVRTYIVEGE